MGTMKEKVDIIEYFNEAKSNGRYLKVSAPMVRYSKLQFRKLVRNYGVDICFTPMIMADSFCQSSYARANEFTTSKNDSPLIVQYAANTARDFVGASQLVYPFADGVDLNCGCPQRWAIKDGYGCALLTKPDLIHQMVREIKNSLPTSFSVSVKVRLLKGLKETINMCKQIENCGVSFITVHGRTQSQKSSEEVNIQALSEVCRSLQVPMVANGGVKSLNDADILYDKVKCGGVMAAGGLLTNPALFVGAEKTPVACIEDWLGLCAHERERITFQCYHHHLVFMLEKILTKKQKQTFNYLTTYVDVENFLEELDITKDNAMNLDLEDREILCEYPKSIVMEYSKSKCAVCLKRQCQCDKLVNAYDSSKSSGNYFTSMLQKDLCDLDHMDSSIFDEL